MEKTDLVVTNFNRNFTGVSATAAAVVRAQQDFFNMQLVGHPLPGCPSPVSAKSAMGFAKLGPATKPVQIWHVRRNVEMQTALFVRDVLRRPIKIVFTSAAQRHHSLWPRRLIKRMDAIIATTNEAASYVDNVRAVVPHGVDTDVYHPAKDRTFDWSQTGYPGQQGIACVGRIRREKGTDRFVDAAIRALPNLPGVTALVIGRAKKEHQGFLESLRQRIAAAGLEERILFVGEIPADKLPALLRSLSLLVALPRYEGYGMTPLEAMASGVPVIATDCGHFREFIGQGQAGHVLETDDPGEAAKWIETLAQDTALRQRLASQCVERAKAHFDISHEVAGIAQVYEQIWREGA